MDRRTTYSELSSQINDKNIVVLEFGRHYTRCGFAGEPAPRSIIKSISTRTITLENGCQKADQVYLYQIKDAAELRSCLGDFIEKIYFSHLAVSPKEKKVVVVESVFCKSLFRNTLVEVLFDRFNVPALLFVPDHLMALATLGHNIGLVLDIGAIEATSIAVVNGVTLLDVAQFASLGAQTLDSLISDEVIKHNPSAKDLLTPEMVEDIRVRTCFIAPFERGLTMTSCKLRRSKEIHTEAIRIAEENNQEISLGTMYDCYFLPDSDEKSPMPLNYSVQGHNMITIPGNLREGACEILFEIFGHEHSLTTLVVETILSAPIDCRRSLAENVLVIGGLANLPGLEQRLANELKNIDKYERFRRKIPDTFKFHKPICPRNYVSWLGASMFCTQSSMELRSTTREHWLNEGRKSFRDWSDLIR